MTEIAIDFAPVMSSTAKIIEVTNDFVKNIQNGEPLYLKGTEKDEAVLCSSSKTFALKRVEQSNTVCLFQEDRSASHWSLQASIKDFFEIIPVEGRVHTIPALVTHCIASSYSYAESIRYVTEHVMASEAEIQRALQQQNVIDNQGTLTILPFQQIVEIYEQLIPLIVRQDWSLQYLSEVQLTQHLQCSRPIVHFVLSKLSSSFTTSDDDDDVIWSLSSESVTTCLLHVLFLRASTLSWSDITSELTARHPHSIDIASLTPASVLSGLAIEGVSSSSSSSSSSSTNKSNIGQYTYYPVEMTPVELQVRWFPYENEMS
jgi:sister chromatid cohesion protein DCC1